MALVTTKEMLLQAQAGGYAVGAFNIENMEMAQAVIATAEELRAWQRVSGLPLRKFFNTSGMLYKSLGLKDKLPSMSEEEQLEILASDGMLVKRPMLIDDDFVLVGFSEAEWKTALRVN